MRVRAGAGGEPVWREFDPDHARVLAIDADGLSRLRDIDRRTGLKHAANRTAAFVGAMPGLVGLSSGGSRVAVTDHGPRKRVRGRDARRPACADGCENLHHQGNQDYG